MKTLETRISEIAAQMDAEGVAKFNGAVPHSIFVKWDDLASIAGKSGYSFKPCDENSSDEELRALILDRESGCDSYYDDKTRDYIEEKAIPVVATRLAREMRDQFPLDGARMGDEDVTKAAAIAAEILSDDDNFFKATGLQPDLRLAFLWEVTGGTGEKIDKGFEYVFRNVWFRDSGKQVHKYLSTDVKKCLEVAVFIWSC